MAKRFNRIFKEQGYGMRFFLDTREPGKVAVADNSGGTPDCTDDGILYVDPTRPMVPYASTGNEFYVNFGVTNPAGDKFGCGCKIEGALFLLGLPILKDAGLHVEVDNQLRSLRNLLEGAHSKDPEVCCPACGNMDTNLMHFTEDVTASRSLHGIDSEGFLIIDDQEFDHSDGDHGRLVCNAAGNDGTKRCGHEFELPEKIEFRNRLEEVA